MAKRKVRTEERLETIKVSAKLPKGLVKEIDDLLATHLYGRNRGETMERLIGERLAVMRKEDEHHLVAELEGFAAYVVNKYTRMTRGDRKQVLDYIVNHWINQNYAHLSGAGIGLQDPEWQKYLDKHRSQGENR